VPAIKSPMPKSISRSYRWKNNVIW